ncbi:MAG: caspase family protein [Saprospiraceae bacterium]
MFKILACFFLFLVYFSTQAQNPKGVSPVSGGKPIFSGNTWAVVVGISDYQNPDIPDLKFADADAIAFINYLRSSAGGTLEESHIKGLINEKATAAQFASALDWLMDKSKEGDQAIIYFSGHGDVERKTITQPGFLLCWDAPYKVYMGGGTFGLTYLQEIISTLSLQSKAKVIVYTDACHSGKLAGSEIGGSQATASNLAKQFANEVKLMSCQPDELSLEGIQWGGGRGVFSYFLVNGLTGLADLNKDGIVTLFEIERFLGDKVTEAISPKSQIPMAIGTKSSLISIVDQASLLALQKNDNPIKITSTNIDIPVTITQTTKDTILLEKYELFKNALKEKHLLTPTENAAWTIYQELKEKPFDTSKLSTMQSNLAAALQDEAQQAINDYLNSDSKELEKRWNFDSSYNNFPIYLKKAAELLGEKHYLYNTIKAREHYFTGLNLRLKGELNNDTTLYNLAKIEQLKTLDLDSSAAYAYNELGYLEKKLKNYLESIIYLRQAILQSPMWVMPWANLIADYSRLGNNKMAIETGLKAISIDSNSYSAHFLLAVAYENVSNWSKAREQYEKSLNLKDIDKDPLFNISYTYYQEKNYDQAEKIINQIIALYPYDKYVCIPLTCIYLKKGMEDKAYEAIEKGLKSGFKDIEAIESEADLKDFIKTSRYLKLKNKYNL